MRQQPDGKPIYLHRNLLHLLQVSELLQGLVESLLLRLALCLDDLRHLFALLDCRGHNKSALLQGHPEQSSLTLSLG